MGTEGYDVVGAFAEALGISPQEAAAALGNAPAPSAGGDLYGGGQPDLYGGSQDNDPIQTAAFRNAVASLRLPTLARRDDDEDEDEDYARYAAAYGIDPTYALIRQMQDARTGDYLNVAATPGDIARFNRRPTGYQSVERY